MSFRGIRWRIAIPYAVLILVSTLGLTIYVSNQVRRARLADLEAQLLAEARLIADNVGPLLVEGKSAEPLDGLARRWATLLDARVTIIAANGTVLGESHEDRTQMGNHLYRPEVQQALNAGQGSSVRFSQTMGYEMMYVAIPVEAAGRVAGIARVALPLREIEANVGLLRRSILVSGLLAALLSVLLALLIAERIALPVRRLTRVAERMADGDLNARLLPLTRDEVGMLTRAFNRMSDRLRGTVNKLVEERGRLVAVLDNMADGVLITDGDGQVRLINPAAAWLLDTSESAALGLSFAQVVRHHQIIELWRRCQEEGEEQIEAVDIGRQGLFLQVIVTTFQEADTRGYLVILQDLTRVRQLETMRRDFISNISHELRTPLAGLKALVDTLRAGAMADPPAAERFLNRMETEVDSLTQMVQELLELSRIESGQVPLQLSPTPVEDVLLLPVDRLLPQAERAGLSLSVELSPDLPLVMADVERVRQVVTNLVHNAIKFTPAGGRILVSSVGFQVSSEGNVQPVTLNLRSEEIFPPGEWVLIAVEDTGVGIPADNLPRIFERFYKADRARSGGGAGLGLAIAKHIVQTHGGHIWAESIEGKGSTFYFSLPAVQR
ncbi:MAG: ATP-binding protein [Chloroflexota bacterium]|nr:ATP-binding protein [Chloroflexota bacterium]